MCYIMVVVRENTKLLKRATCTGQKGKTMKKILTLIALSFIALASISAASQNVDINAKMAETELTASLMYDNVFYTADIDLYQNMKDETPWNLAEAGETKDFKILVSGNQNKNHTLHVAVSASAFHGLVNGIGTGAPNKVTVSKVDAEQTISAGYHDNSVLSTFHISWDGKGNEVIAGTYVSDVVITYSIE